MMLNLLQHLFEKFTVRAKQIDIKKNGQTTKDEERVPKLNLRQHLLEKFTKRADPKDIKKIEKKLFSMQRGPIAEIWDKVLSLWQLVSDTKVPLVKKAAAIGALVYLVSPLDAVPDVIPVAGLVDDVAVILSVVKMLADALKQHAVDVAEAKALVAINKHSKMVKISVIGAIIIASLALVLRLLFP